MTGVGAIPVSILRDLAPDAVWHALVTNGREITTYTSLTRTIPTPALTVATPDNPTCAREAVLSVLEGRKVQFEPEAVRWAQR